MRIRLGIALCFIGAVVIVSWIMCCANALAHEVSETGERIWSSDHHHITIDLTYGHGHTKGPTYTHIHDITEHSTFRHYHSPFFDGGNKIKIQAHYDMHHDAPDAPPPPPPSTTSQGQSTSSTSTPSSTPTPRQAASRSTDTPIVLPDPDDELPTPDDTSMIDNPVEAVVETEPVELVYHEWTWLKGHNLVSFPVMREGIETVADLYQEYALFDAPQDIIYVVIDGGWYPYNGQDGQVAGEVRITPYLGVLMVMDWSAILGMRGVKQIGDGELELMPGLNVVGLSELPSRYQVPSDFLEIDGVETVLVIGWDDEEGTNRNYMIGRAGGRG